MTIDGPLRAWTNETLPLRKARKVPTSRQSIFYVVNPIKHTSAVENIDIISKVILVIFGGRSYKAADRGPLKSGRRIWNISRIIQSSLGGL